MYLQLPNNSDNNLSEYLNAKFDEFIAEGQYSEEDIRRSRELLDLYVDAKTDFEEGIGITDNSKNAFEYFLSSISLDKTSNYENVPDNSPITVWDTMKSAVKAIILEDCFSNPNSNSEQFLFMRDNYIKQNGKVYSYASSSRYREHIILPDEVDIVKDYCALRQLKNVGFGEEELDKLIERDMIINKSKTFINNKLPDSEKNKRKEKARINGLFRISSALEGLLYLSKQEDDEKYAYFDKDLIINNIKEAASDKDSVKSLLSTSMDQIVSRANFIRWQDDQTKPGGLLEGERMMFNSKGFINALMKSNNSFWKLFDRELQLAEQSYIYSFENPKINLRKMYEVNVSNIEDPKEFEEFNSEYVALFLVYAFGSPSSYQEEKLDKLYKKTVDYYKDLENELKSVRRQAERKEEHILEASDRNNDEPKGKYSKLNNESRKPTFDEEKVDKFLEEAARYGMRCNRIINVGRIGTPDIGKDGLIYYVLEKDNKENRNDKNYIWEPVGQPNNATLIFKTDKSIEELADDIGSRRVSIDDLVRHKEVCRMWHSDCSPYDVSRLDQVFSALESNEKVSKIMRAVLISELERDYLSLHGLTIRGTKSVPKEEMFQAADYIKRIERIKEMKVRGLEKESGVTIPTLERLRKRVNDLNRD